MVNAWAVLGVAVGCLAVAAVLGLLADRVRRRPHRERLLACSPEDEHRAEMMSRYYVANHGTEW